MDADYKNVYSLTDAEAQVIDNLRRVATEKRRHQASILNALEKAIEMQKAIIFHPGIKMAPGSFIEFVWGSEDECDGERMFNVVEKIITAADNAVEYHLDSYT